jgi:hypothetical protein
MMKIVAGALLAAFLFWDAPPHAQAAGAEPATSGCAAKACLEQAYTAAKETDTILILVARHGAGERRAVNARYLRAARPYVIDHFEEDPAVVDAHLVLAEGQAATGPGRVDVVVQGRVYCPIAFSRNAPIWPIV